MVFTLKKAIYFILGLSMIFIAVYGFEITTGYFTVKNYRKDLKSCAVQLLSKLEYGVHMSELTGKCEKITSYETQKAGNSYAKTDVMEKKFTNPVDTFEPIFWEEVKGIRPGFRFDLFFSNPSGVPYEVINIICISFTNASHELKLYFFSGKDFENANQRPEENLYILELANGITNTLFKKMPIEKSGSNMIVKLSILAQSKSVKIMFDNEDYLTYPLQIVNTNSMQRFTVDILHAPLGGIRKLMFHGYRISVM